MFEAGSVVRFVNAYFGEFKAPKHANALYTLGAVLVLALLLQASSGLALAVHYVPIASTAF